MVIDRRGLLEFVGASALGVSMARSPLLAQGATPEPGKPDYTIQIANGLAELGSDQIIAATLYNGQFPGPLLRFREGQDVTIEIRNDTGHPELLHWHGRRIPSDVDGAEEEGSRVIPAGGLIRETITPRPSGLRFYHSHVRAGADLGRGQYSGLVGPVYIEPKDDPGHYDQEVFLVLKEFGPTFSRGGDMDQDFLAGEMVKALKDRGEAAMKASRGQRVLLHVLNGSATEIRSLAMAGHRFRVIALDGNPVPTQAAVPVLWIGTAERVSAIVDMNHPGVFVLGDLADDDRGHGMGIVIEYSGAHGKPHWQKPPALKWDYTAFGAVRTVPVPDEVIDMVFVKDNAADGGFNRWTINGAAYPDTMEMVDPMLRLTAGRRYRLHMRNESDDIPPIRLHRHSFELTRIAGKPTAGVIKDVVMLGGYQEADIDFVADNPGPTLFHCHQQLHMDFGFMALFDYVKSG
jgi:FtsP/CotA-like multicopper oxidase with cupredoxin domain